MSNALYRLGYRLGNMLVGILIISIVPMIYGLLWWLLGPESFWQKFAMLVFMVPFLIVEFFVFIFAADKYY